MLHRHMLHSAHFHLGYGITSTILNEINLRKSLLDPSLMKVKKKYFTAYFICPSHV